MLHAATLGALPASKMLLRFSRPPVARLKADAALPGATCGLDGVEVAHLEELYADGAFALHAEVARIAAGRIVLQCPIRRSSTPPLLKAWQDIWLGSTVGAAAMRWWSPICSRGAWCRPAQRCRAEPAAACLEPGADRRRAGL
ncbi:hypothetical protein [Teichococcus deserti]|uniref:hypothetical protein n=1 Tax=Teichococcus deserti TaxID=1817963 RepID=UPI001A968829|nr:hypothetical protein [Pseudoroseomonas deserti]